MSAHQGVDGASGDVATRQDGWWWWWCGKVVLVVLDVRIVHLNVNKL